jgi:hypothetical protein
MDGYATHQPVLIELLRRLNKPKVLELGIGYSSTPFIVKDSSYSEHYDTDSHWLELLKDYQKENHIFKLVNNHDKYNWYESEIFSKEWDIAFIDNASGESRQSNLMKLKDKAQFIICHDTEEVYKPAASNYGWNFSSFKYHFVYTEYNIYTTVISNFQQFSM